MWLWEGAFSFPWNFKVCYMQFDNNIKAIICILSTTLRIWCSCYCCISKHYPRQGASSIILLPMHCGTHKWVLAWLLVLLHGDVSCECAIIQRLDNTNRRIWIFMSKLGLDTIQLCKYLVCDFPLSVMTKSEYMYMWYSPLAVLYKARVVASSVQPFSTHHSNTVVNQIQRMIQFNATN